MKPKLKLVRREHVVDIGHLLKMGSVELQCLHKGMFGATVPAGNPELARRRIAWQVQANRDGGLPESAREYAIAIARNVAARVRLTSNLARREQGLPLPHSVSSALPLSRDSSLPMAGSVITKTYRGRTLIVHVLDSGFEFEGKRYPSLSKLATEITGTRWNGLAFFGLRKGAPGVR